MKESLDDTEARCSSKIGLRGKRPSDNRTATEISQSPWISVKERLPDKDTKVIIVDNGDVSVVTYGHGRAHDEWWDELNTDMDASPTDCGNVTHWMPLPEPPKE